MKKLILMSSILATSVGFSQMIEDFEGATAPGLPTGWTQVATGSDGGFLTTSDLSSQYFVTGAHTQYVGTSDDICDCDKSMETLMSSTVAIPATGADLFTFDYVTGAYYGETANFGYTTDGGATVTDLGLLASTRVGSTNDHDWGTASFLVGALAGTSVQFVWTYQDEGGWGSGLLIDDFQMISLPTVDMEMTALNLTATIVAGNATISGTVTSSGADNLSSIDVTWNDGSGLNSETFAVNLNYGDTYNFTHGTQLTAVAGETYNLDVCVVATGDVDNTNDCMSGSISAVSSIVQKVTVGEEKTGEWCGWCPRGTVAMAEMAISNPNDFIGIAVHNGDPMAITNYDLGYSPDFTGYPHGAVDRIVGGDPSSFSAMHTARASEIPPASIDVVSSTDGNTVTVVVTSTFVGGLNGDYRLAAVLLQDGINGMGQANYYNDGGSGALQNPNGGSMPNLNWVGAGATVSPIIHDHVAVALGNNQYNGTAGSLPVSLSPGDVETYTYTFTQDASWVIGNMHAVGMLVNGTTSEVLNAGKSAITGTESLSEEFANNFSISAMPNPTNGVANIVVDLAVAAEMNMVIVDVLGNEVYNYGNETLEAGTHTTKIDLTNNAEGIYFAKVNLNGAVKTVKINVVK
ncbi:MAG: Omp28-related outer membrane protein [Flavobacteriales bacterium]|nr:Omp28-related outer membrane protein [Flavobacteriales bacterium]